MTAERTRYFKHIFAGSERIATKQGNGFVALPSLAVQSNGAGTGDSTQTNADLPPSEAPLVPVVSHQVGWQAYIQGLGACASGTNNSFTLSGNLNFSGTTNVHLRNLQNTAEEDRINYYHSDHLGSTGFMTLSGKNSSGPFVRVTRHYQYLPFGENFIEQSNLAGQYQNPYEFNGKEKDLETGYNYYGARHYNSSWGVWLSVDPLADEPEQVDKSPYAAFWNNPIMYDDPDGRCPNCLTAAIGAGIGALIGGGVEIASQLYNNGSVNNWSAVGGSALQGGITGGAAGFTGGASLLTTAAVAGGANAVGGAANRATQGQGTTLTNIATDATVGAVLGAGGKLVGNAVSSGTNNLSNSAKGKLGEAVTEIKYGAQGYKSAGNDVVKTGGKTATGRQAEARFDHKMTNVFTGKQITVESKFNGAGYTPNQKALVDKGYPVILDRTTSQGLGNGAKAATVGAGAGVDAQRNKKP